MTNLILHRESTPRAMLAPLPGPRERDVAIRVATMDDLPFIDALQKKHSRMVGFLFLDTLEKHIKLGNVLIAEQQKTPLGYCVFQDKYDKHEDCGIFYQVNIVPGSQRGLIGAALVKAALDRAAYGCKLACCWCAQDLEANHFWESLGFVPLAFRTGSRTAGSKKTPRIHIFWQRRIREGDEGVGATPYWYPSKTEGGAVKESRIALPIPPGTHWSDAKPAVLPGMENFNVLPAGAKEEREKKPRVKKDKAAVPAKRPSCGMWFAPPAPPAPPTPKPGSPEAIAAKKAAKAAAPKPKREKFVNDPKLVAAAREFRDRYLDEVNSGRHMLESAGKYEVSRQLSAAPIAHEPIALLNAA